MIFFFKSYQTSDVNKYIAKVPIKCYSYKLTSILFIKPVNYFPQVLCFIWVIRVLFSPRMLRD